MLFLLLMCTVFVQRIHFVTSVYYAYVTREGVFNTECSKEKPCGQLSYVLFNSAKSRRTINDSHVIIYVNGANNSVSPPTAFNDDYYLQHCYPFIETSFTIIFNSSIRSTQDWHPLLSWCLANRESSWMSSITALWIIRCNSYVSIQVENLVYDNTACSLIDMTNSGWTRLDLASSFCCKNCLFRNLSADQNLYQHVSKPALMRLGAQTVFENCTFENILVTPQTSSIITDGYDPSDWISFIKIFGNASFIHCQFHNISAVGSNGYFISTTVDDGVFKFITFDHITVNNVDEVHYRATRFIYANYEEVKFNSYNTINIISSSFTGPLNIIYVDQGPYFIYINNIYIEATQYDDSNSYTFDEINHYLKTRVSSNKSYFLYNTIYNGDGSTLTFNNSYYETQLKCRYTTIACHDIPMAMYIYQSFPICEPPMGLLYNDGTATLTNLTLTSNYNATFYKQYLLKTWNITFGGMYYLHYEFFDIGTTGCQFDLSYLPYYSAIYNDYSGQLTMYNSSFTNGANRNLLTNLGIAYIENMLTGNNADQYLSDQWILNPLTMFENRGYLMINDSELKMSDVAIFQLYSGSLFIDNSSISHCSVAIHSAGTVDKMYLNKVHISETGLYAMQVPLVYYVNSYHKTYITDKSYLVPIYISSKYISITNCYFEYISPLGLIKFANINEDIDEGMIYLDNNIFLATGKMHLRSIDTNHSSININALNPKLIVYIVGMVSSTLTITEINELFQNEFKNTGHISIPDPYTIVFGRNQFVYNVCPNTVSNTSRFILNYSIPWIFINTSTTDNCMASNIFHNYAILIEAGNLLSCKHPNILKNNNNSDCFVSLGPPNNLYTNKSQFISNLSFCNNAEYAMMIHSQSYVLMDYVEFLGYNTTPVMITSPGTITFSIVDTLLISDNAVSSLEVPLFCQLNCYQVVDNDSNKIRQAVIECDQNLINSTGTYAKIEELAEIYEITESFSYWSASKVHIYENGSFYPGGMIDFYYLLFDEYGNHVQEYQYPIKIDLAYDKFNIYSVMTINENGVCDLCETRLYVEVININHTGSFMINTFVEDKSLTVNDINVSIIDCPSGFGVDGSMKQCTPCSQGTYSLQSNRKLCQVCDANLRGISCSGSNIIAIDFNYWMKVNSQGQIISSDCPSKYCCSDMKGCEYINDYEQLCALNRDPTTPLCGKCIHGTSEVFGSNHCKVCNGTHFEYILVPMFLCILAAMYFLYFDKPSPSINEQFELDELSKLIIKDQFTGTKIMFFKVLVYFYQTLLLILLLGAPDTVHYIFPILQILNISIDYSTDNDKHGGYCFYEGMTALSKILLRLLPAAMLLFVISTVMMFIFFGISLEIKGRKPRYINAFWRAALIGIGTILSVFLKLLACRQIGNKYVHFYYGSHFCYDRIWYTSLIILIFIMATFGFLWLKLYKLSSSKRQSRQDNHLHSLVASYDEKHWYWEFVILSRRFIISLFTTIFYNSHKYWNAALCIILMIYWAIQIKMSPFKHQRSNTLETICILILIISLILITLTEMNHTSDQSQLALSILLIIGILAPFFIFLYQLFRFICNASCFKERTASEQRMLKLIKRTPKSQQAVLNNAVNVHHIRMELQDMHNYNLLDDHQQ
eukprot:196358_1